MQVEVGSIVEGKITGITNFGAFVALPEGKTGMVHISEISNSYVKEIGDFISTEQEVKVMVLSIADDGKISLSMKRCEENAGISAERPVRTERPERPDRSMQQRPPQQRRRTNSSKDITWQPKKADSMGDLSFEDMMSQFKQVSNDRMGELKRANEPRKSRRSSGGPK